MKYQQFKQIKNWRQIEPNEIVIDCDNKKGLGDIGIRHICMVMSLDGYKIEIWKAEGQKSYHAHIKEIPHLEDLNKEQRRKYKEIILKKYISQVREFIEAPELDNIDFTLCANHSVAQEGKPHYKYGTIKTLRAVINEDNQNFCDIDVLEQAKQGESIKIYKQGQSQGETLAQKIAQKISIIGIAKQFGIKVHGNMAVCPFHADTNPSLSLDDQKGLFHCFGCHVSGNIIKFYYRLKKLNPDFEVVVKNE